MCCELGEDNPTKPLSITTIIHQNPRKKSRGVNDQSLGFQTNPQSCPYQTYERPMNSNNCGQRGNHLRSDIVTEISFADQTILITGKNHFTNNINVKIIHGHKDS